MSTIASITVKKNDGTTDVVYTAIEGRSGNNPARYRAPALGATAATQPELRIGSTVPNAGKGKPRVTGTFHYPYSVVNSTTGVTTVVDREFFRIEHTGSPDVPQAVIDEAVSQFFNLLGSTAVKTQFKERSAAT